MDAEKINELRALFARDRFATLLGIELTHIDYGTATACVTIDERHLNGGDVAHGGVLFTLADFAMAAAANASGKLAFSVNAGMQFLVSARKGETLTAVAREIYMHKTLCHYTVEVRNEQNLLIATLNGTCYRKENR